MVTMARKRTPRQQLVDMYDQMLMEYLQRAYVVHCTASKRECDTAQQALTKDYQECMRRFRKKLDEVIDPLEEKVEELHWDNMQARMGDDF